MLKGEFSGVNAWGNVGKSGESTTNYGVKWGVEPL